MWRLADRGERKNFAVGTDPRPAGNDDFLQLRIVAPIALKTFTILPRLTFRHYENAQGESGIGNTELFGLIIPKSWDWGSGRFGIGPLVTLPGNQKISKDEWGYGFAMAAVNGAGNWFYGAGVRLQLGSNTIVAGVERWNLAFDMRREVLIYRASGMHELQSFEIMRESSLS